MSAAGSRLLPRLALIGAGRAGREFARHCLSAGYDVVLEDVLPANLRRAETEMGTSTPQPSGTLHLVTSVAEAVRTADIAIDFVPDDLESKLEIFSMIDRMAPPKTLLLTPSDSLSIADLASCTYRPQQCFALQGLHDSAAFSHALPSVQLTHPAAASADGVRLIGDLLDRLGLPYTTSVDQMPSLLTGR